MKLAPTRTLVCINMLAIAGLVWLWVDQHGKLRNIEWVAPAPVNAVMVAPTLLAQSSNVDRSAFATTLERPLFTPDRRPPPPVLPDAPPPPPDPLADAHLLGLISGPSGSVLIRADGKVSRIGINQKIGEWSLKAVADRTATFGKAKETRTIRLEYASLGTPVPAPVNQNAPASAGPSNMPVAAPAPRAAPKSQIDEEEAKNRDLAAMRARMSQTKP